MNIDQISSLVRTVLKWLGAYLIAHGYAKTGTFINAPDIIGALLTLVGLVWSHTNHADDSATTSKPSGTDGSGSGKLLSLLLLGALATFWLTGCQLGAKKLEVGGDYAPANFVVSTDAQGLTTTNVTATQAPDIMLYALDSSFDLAESTIQGVFKAERDNRAFLWSVSPQIKHSLDKIRPVAWDVIRRYTQARSVYLANPTPANLTVMQELLSKGKALALSAIAASAPTNLPPVSLSN